MIASKLHLAEPTRRSYWNHAGCPVRAEGKLSQLNLGRSAQEYMRHGRPHFGRP